MRTDDMNWVVNGSLSKCDRASDISELCALTTTAGSRTLARYQVFTGAQVT